MRWLDPAWWNHVREEYPDRFALCCGVAVAAAALGGYATVSTLGGGSAAAGDYGLTGKHPAATQPLSPSLSLPTGVTAGTLGSRLAQDLLAPSTGDGAGVSSTGADYAAAQRRVRPPYRSGSPGQTTGPGVVVVTTVVTPTTTETQAGGTTVIATTTTTTAVAPTTTQTTVTLPTPVTTVTVPLPSLP